MGKMDPKIDALAARAGRRSLAEKTDVFRQVVEMFISGEVSDSGEARDALLELAAVLIPQTDRAARKEIAERLARMPSPPMDLVLELAHDDVALVAPLLQRAPFSDRELIELIRQTDRDHHMVIARRADLTLDVWLALARAATRSRPSADTLTRLRRDWEQKTGILTEAATDEEDVSAAEAEFAEAAETPQAAEARTQAAVQSQQPAKRPVEQCPAEDVLPKASGDGEGRPRQRIRLRDGFYELDDNADDTTESAPDDETAYRAEPAGKMGSPPSEEASPAKPVDAKDGDRGAVRGAGISQDRPRAAKGVQYEAARTGDEGTAGMTKVEMPTRWIEEAPGAAFSFCTDRAGRIVGLSQKAEQAFGDEASELFGREFLSVFAGPDNDRHGYALLETIRRHLPLRGLPATSRIGRRRLRWTITGRALFSFPDGRFQGYEGRATAADDLTRRVMSVERDDDRLVDDVLDIARQISLATEPDSASPELAALHGKATDLYSLARRLQARLGGERSGNEPPL